MCLRDRLLHFKLLTGMLLFCLPPPGCFLNGCPSRLLAAVLKCFFCKKHQLPLALQIPTNQHPRSLQLGRYFFTRKEGRFYRKLAQKLRNCALCDVQFFCSREVEECLMQPFYTLVLLQMSVGNLSKQENKSRYSHRDKGNLLTRRVSQINVYAVKRVFQ